MGQNLSSPSGDKGGADFSSMLPNGTKKFMKEYRTPLSSAMASCVATGTLVSDQSSVLALEQTQFSLTATLVSSGLHEESYAIVRSTPSNRRTTNDN